MDLGSFWTKKRKFQSSNKEYKEKNKEEISSITKSIKKKIKKKLVQVIKSIIKIIKKKLVQVKKRIIKKKEEITSRLKLFFLTQVYNQQPTPTLHCHFFIKSSNCLRISLNYIFCNNKTVRTFMD